jgi:hypothetical protein
MQGAGFKGSRVQSFRVQGLGCRDHLQLETIKPKRIQGCIFRASGFRVQGSGCRVEEFRVQSIRVQGVGCRVQG